MCQTTFWYLKMCKMIGDSYGNYLFACWKRVFFERVSVCFHSMKSGVRWFGENFSVNEVKYISKVLLNVWLWVLLMKVSQSPFTHLQCILFTKSLSKSLHWLILRVFLVWYFQSELLHFTFFFLSSHIPSQSFESTNNSRLPFKMIQMSLVK